MEQGYNKHRSAPYKPSSFSLLAGSQHINSSHFVSYSWLDGGGPSATILLEL